MRQRGMCEKYLPLLSWKLGIGALLCVGGTRRKVLNRVHYEFRHGHGHAGRGPSPGPMHWAMYIDV
jgi:hypothetical protein